MYQEYKRPPFDKVFLTAVFVGIMITLVALIFDVLFIQTTGFPYLEIINVSSLIFAINLLFLVIGPVYYGFISSSRFGEIIFIGLFVLLTIFLLLRIKTVQRTDDAILNIEFRHLLKGLVIIVGAGASILLPLLFHNKKFKDNVV